MVNINPSYILIIMLSRGNSLHNTLYSTPALGGRSLGEIEAIWEELAASVARIKLMDRLAEFKVGFNDVEMFNMGLIFNSKMTNESNYTGKDDRKVVGEDLREGRNWSKLAEEDNEALKLEGQGQEGRT